MGNRCLVLGGALFLATLVVKVYVALHLDLFGDGAYYWVQAQHLAWSYSEVPYATALLVWLGTGLVGDTLLGTRAAFLIIGSTLPWLIYTLAKPITGQKDALDAAGFVLITPIFATLGIMALPDVPMLAICIAGLATFERATRTGRLSWWVVTGLLIALGFGTHYRFVLFPVCVGLYLLLTSQGRSCWRTPGPWVAAAIAIPGLAPIAYFNWVHDFASIQFNYQDRHEWVFHADGLLYLVKQAGVVTPLIFVALIGALMHALRAWKRGDHRAGLIAIFGGVPLFLFSVLAPWADFRSTSEHWALVSYPPLIVFLPTAIRGLGPRLRRIVPASGLVFLALGLVYLVAAANYGALPQPVQRLVTNKLSGWSEVGRRTEQHLDSTGVPDRLVLVNDYYLAAQIEFVNQGRALVFDIDDQRIHRHGRTLNRKIWQRDEASLVRNFSGQDALIVILHRKRYFGNAVPLQYLKGRFANIRPIEELCLYDGRRCYSFFVGEELGEKLGEKNGAGNAGS